MLESADVAFGTAALLEEGTNNHADFGLASLCNRRVLFGVDVVQMHQRL
jgi:hypothetical protein